MNKQEIEFIAIATMEKEGWHVDRTEDGSPLFLSEGNLAVACVEAGIAATASPVVGSGPEDPWKFMLYGNDNKDGLGVLDTSLYMAFTYLRERTVFDVDAIETALKSRASALSPAPIATEGAGQGWVSVKDMLPEPMPDEWVGIEPDDEDEIKQANRQSEDMLICRTVQVPMNEPYEAVKVARYYPGSHKGRGAWLEADSGNWIWPHHWMPLPTPPQPQPEAQSHA